MKYQFNVWFSSLFTDEKIKKHCDSSTWFNQFLRPHVELDDALNEKFIALNNKENQT